MEHTNWMRLVLTDLDAALTFLDVAEVTLREDGVTRTQAMMWRNRENARTAYDTVLRLLAKLPPTAADRERPTIDAKLALLKARLQAAGYEL